MREFVDLALPEVGEFIDEKQRSDRGLLAAVFLGLSTWWEARWNYAIRTTHDVAAKPEVYSNNIFPSRCDRRAVGAEFHASSSVIVSSARSTEIFRFQNWRILTKNS